MIIAAAIKIEVYTQYGSADTTDVIIAGTRHSDCYEALQTLSPFLAESASNEGKIIEGFITNSPYEKFVDREKAYLIARTNRQLPASVIVMKEKKGEKELYSEDLY